MKSAYVRWCGLWAAVFLLGAGTALTAEFTEEYSKTFPLADGAPVRVENINGKVEISAWNEMYAEVRAVKRTKKDRNELSRAAIEVNTANGLEIRTVYQKGKAGKDGLFSQMFGSVSTNPQVNVDYAIRIPKTAALSQAKTVNGAVILRETGGSTVAKTTNGTISAENVSRIESAETTNGNISVSGSAVLNARAVNGSISVKVTGVSPDAMNVSTVNGSVSLVVSPVVNVEVELKTVNGLVTAPEGILLNQGVVSPKRVSGRLGSGGRTISAETINGSVSLKKDTSE